MSLCTWTTVVRYLPTALPPCRPKRPLVALLPLPFGKEIVTQVLITVNLLAFVMLLTTSRATHKLRFLPITTAGPKFAQSLRRQSRIPANRDDQHLQYQSYVHTVWSLASSFAIIRLIIDIRRTEESATNLFTGLYPLDTRPSNTALTMNVRPSAIEVMIPNPSACPRLGTLIAEYSVSPAYAETQSPYSALQNTFLSAYNTSGVKGFNTTSVLFDTASATYCAGLGLQGKLTAADIRQAVIPALSSYHNLVRPSNPNAEEVKRLSVGGWLIEILGSLSYYTSPLEVYSVHDASLDIILAVVAEPDLPWPPFASNILTEVWQQEYGEMVVRMFYEGMIVPAAPGLGCSFQGCPLDILEKWLKRYIPKSFDEACSL